MFLMRDLDARGNVAEVLKFRGDPSAAFVIVGLHHPSAVEAEADLVAAYRQGRVQLATAK
jgi:hypothetical protein